MTLAPGSRRRLRRLTAVLLLAIAAVLAVRHAGTFLEAPSQMPVKADLIVNLGGELGERSEKTAEMYRAGLAGVVLVTGMPEAPPGARQQIAHWRKSYLIEQGVPEKAMLFDSSATNSREEAAHVLKMMGERGWQRVLVVSDPPHLRRLQWTWERTFAGSGKEFVLVAAPMQEWHPQAWWREERSGAFVITEYIKLAYYMAARR